MAKKSKVKFPTVITQPGLPNPALKAKVVRGSLGASANAVPQTPFVGTNPITPTPLNSAASTAVNPSLSNMTDQNAVQEQAAAAKIPSAAPAQVSSTKKKSKVSANEPLSPETWTNIGNDPLAYNDYLAAFKQSKGKK